MVLFGKAYEFNMATCPRNYYSLQRKKVGGNIRVWSQYENIGRKQSKRWIIRHITPTLKRTLIAYRNRTGKYFLFFLWINELLCFMHTSRDSFEFSRDSKLWTIRTLHPWNNMIVVHHKLMGHLHLCEAGLTHYVITGQQSTRYHQPVVRGKTSYWQGSCLKCGLGGTGLGFRSHTLTLSWLFPISSFSCWLQRWWILRQMSPWNSQRSPVSHLSFVVGDRISQHHLWL